MMASNSAAANSANCGKWFYGLDGSNPEVIAYVTKIVRRATEEWGFEVLKLDFLYSCCLKGRRHDMSMTRAQVYNQCMRCIRDAAGDAFIIGCGAPMIPSIGFVDGMRISADTSSTYKPLFPLPWWDETNLPCLRSMIRNTVTRAGFSHRFWHNDPDCLLLRGR